MTYFEQSYSFRCSFRTSLKPSLFKTITCLRQLLSGYETSLFPFLVQVQSKKKHLWESSILGFSCRQYCSCPNQPGLLYWVLCCRGPYSGPPLALLWPSSSPQSDKSVRICPPATFSSSSRPSSPYPGNPEFSACEVLSLPPGPALVSAPLCPLKGRLYCPKCGQVETLCRICIWSCGQGLDI